MFFSTSLFKHHFEENKIVDSAASKTFSRSWTLLPTDLLDTA